MPTVARLPSLSNPHDHPVFYLRRLRASPMTSACRAKHFFCISMLCTGMTACLAAKMPAALFASTQHMSAPGPKKFPSTSSSALRCVMNKEVRQRFSQARPLAQKQQNSTVAHPALTAPTACTAPATLNLGEIERFLVLRICTSSRVEPFPPLFQDARRLHLKPI